MQPTVRGCILHAIGVNRAETCGSQKRRKTVRAINLKKMSVDELLTLRERVNAALSSLVKQERSELETRLRRLQGFTGEAPRRGRPPGSTNKLARKSLRGRKVAPKYRNPTNRSDNWAGRGLQPRWLKAALKSGKKLEDFRIKG
jgi:DNA-binding protein H-NS